MRIVTIPVGPLETNCYLAYDEETKDGVIVDPGFEPDKIKAEVAKRDLHILAIFNTHGHFDHVSANDVLREEYKAPLYIHKEDEALFVDPVRLRESFIRNQAPQKPADHYFEPGSRLTIGSLAFTIYHTPGHTLGGVCLVNHEAKVCLCGDTIFKGTVGRTDLWGGSYEDLLASIQTVLEDLADDVVIYPGHGPNSTMGFERDHNPYFRAPR